MGPHLRKWDNFRHTFERRFAELCVSFENTIIFLTTYLSSQDAFLRSRFPKLGVAVPALLLVPVPRPLASGAVSASLLTKANADDLLRDLVSLMDQVFMHKPRTEDACQWQVASFTMNRDDKKIEYGVLFADCDFPLQMGNNEIVNLIMESSQICKPPIFFPERSLFQVLTFSHTYFKLPRNHGHPGYRALATSLPAFSFALVSSLACPNESISQGFPLSLSQCIYSVPK